MISREQLGRIGELAGAQPVSEQLVTQLRSSFPEIHFTCCMDDDVIGATPLLEQAGFNLYLIDSRSHCLCFTQDLALATGVVVAEVEAEA